MERRPRNGFSTLDRKKSSESATQQYKVADVDPHNYNVFETRYRQYLAKLTRSGKKWSVKFETRSAPVSPNDTSDLDTDEGQHITQQVLQAAGQFPVKIGEKIFYVQPAIEEHKLLAPGGRASPPRFISTGGGEGPPPPAHQVLSL